MQGRIRGDAAISDGSQISISGDGLKGALWIYFADSYVIGQIEIAVGVRCQVEYVGEGGRLAGPPSP